uniref:Uncharacterized protein n=1 Tax=Glossina pallidipes TaxID=7398 RepID=A0A1B0AD76_GLOPL
MITMMLMLSLAVVVVVVVVVDIALINVDFVDAVVVVVAVDDYDDDDDDDAVVLYVYYCFDGMGHHTAVNVVATLYFETDEISDTDKDDDDDEDGDDKDALAMLAIGAVVVGVSVTGAVIMVEPTKNAEGGISSVSNQSNPPIMRGVHCSFSKLVRRTENKVRGTGDLREEKFLEMTISLSCMAAIVLYCSFRWLVGWLCLRSSPCRLRLIIWDI